MNQTKMNIQNISEIFRRLTDFMAKKLLESTANKKNNLKQTISHN